LNVELVKTYQFEAAHKTSFKRGDLSPIHGHSFRVDIVVEGPCDPKLGWLIDYGDISAVFDPLYDQLDHKFLNEVPGIGDPSLRGVRLWILERLRPSMPLLKDIRVEIVGAGSFKPNAVSPGSTRFTFEAAHFLPNLPVTHKCRHMHGHSFHIDIVDSDPGETADRLKDIYDTLDHGCLNDVAGLENPTSEIVSQWIWKRLAGSGATPTEIIVAETCTARCIYRGQ
jgi:6-pyruvoyltetrahydropterin/6-carboxytetrahydropterin synthase